jgi:NAD(P)H-flavin reductase
VAPSKAILSERHDAGGELLLVSLDVSADAARAYTTPGQYIEVKTERGKGFFVLASAVGATPWQVLVKNAGDAADALFTLPLGSALDVVGPLGAGFSAPGMDSRHVAVAVVGSALGVARPVHGRRIHEGAAARTHLFLGIRSPTDMPISSEVEVWTAAGVHVVLCLSRSELDHHPEIAPRARRVAGYVQHALAKALAVGDVPHGTLVIAAGPDAMLADMRALADVGSPAEGVVLAAPSIEVLTNV